MKISEVNTLLYGKCIKILVDEQFQHIDGQIGVDVGLQMPDGANDSVKFFFISEKTVTNLIIGYQPGVDTIEVKPHHTAAYFQLRCI